MKRLFERLMQNPAVRAINSRVEALLERLPFVKRFLKNASWLYLANLFGQGIGFFLMLFVVSRYPVEDYGRIGLVTAYCMSVGIIIDFRIWESVINYYGGFREQGLMRKAMDALKLCYGIDFFSGLLSFVIIAVTADLAAQIFLDDPELASLIRIYNVMQLIITANGTSLAVMRVHDKYQWMGVNQMIASVGRAILIIGFVSYEATLESIFLAYLFSGVIKSVLANGSMLLILRRETAPIPADSPRMSRSEIWKLLKFTTGTNAFGTLQHLSMNATILVMGLFASDTAVGLYRLADNLIRITMQFRNPFAEVVYPDIAKAVAVHDQGRLRKILRSATAISGTALGGLCLGLILFVGPILSLVLPDSEYIQAVPYIQIMLIGTLVSFVFFWMQVFLTARNKMLVINALMVLRFVVWGLSGFLLVPLLGDIAWAYMYTIGLLFWIGGQAIYIRQSGLLEFDGQSAVSQPATG